MKIARVNVVEEVVKHLKSKLLSGEWKPGQQIDTEASLCKQLNVSNASVRSAIQHLVAMGVLESQQGRGTFVKSLSLIELQNSLSNTCGNGSIRKMVEFRIIVEGEICRNLAPKISEQTLQHLYDSIEHLKENVADPELTFHYDLEFHRCLYLATHNEYIIQSLNVICDDFQTSHVANHSEGTVLNTIKEHTLIADSLRAGDGEGARRSMIFHLAGIPLDPPFNRAAGASGVSLFEPDVL